MSGENSMVRLKSSDAEIFKVEVAVAYMSETVKNMMVDLGQLGDNLVPLSNVSSKTLAKVIEYCKYHVESEESSEEEMKQRDAEFVKVDKDMIIDILNASNYLNIPKLLDLVCQVVADMIRGKTAEEIRKTFGIKNDFTPAEEEEIRRENEWIINDSN